MTADQIIAAALFAASLFAFVRWATRCEPHHPDEDAARGGAR